MAGADFQIPGLGQAKPNEQLPAENFAPDLLAAAASIVGEDGVVTNLAHDATQQQEEKAHQGDRTIATTTRTDDDMEVDGSGTSSHSGTVTGDSETDRQKDTKMHDRRHGDAEGLTMEVDSGTKRDAPPSPEVTHALEAATDSGAKRDAPPSPEVTHALEAALDGMLSQDAGAGGQTGQQGASSADQEEATAEWEADSSPYESSSESSSSDSSSDDGSEDEGGYPLLGIEETARLLMAGENDEGDGDGSGKLKGGAALRTKNEMPEEVIPKPDVTITPEMMIEPLGNIEFIVENTVVIKSQTPGEVQVLDSGSVLCKEDRTVIGALADVLGSVRSPLYTVGFPTEDEIKELQLAVGIPIFYSVDHAQYVFTQPLRAAKGTDASNLHDEEAAAHEMEFSDDEKEAEYKRQRKLKKRPGRGGREQSSQPGAVQSPSVVSSATLNYDDDEDGPYKPLARPSGFGQAAPPSLPTLPPKPETGFSLPRGGLGHGHRGAHRGGRGDFRGRNNRGAHRGGDRRHGHRGGGGGSYPQFGRDGPDSAQASFNIPPPPPANPHLPPPPFGAKPPVPAGQWPAAPVSYSPPPVSYPHSPPPRPQMGPPHHPAPSRDFTFNYQTWNQTQGQQYQSGYPHAAPHQQPTPQQPPHPTGYAQPFVPPQAPAWPPAAAVPQAAPAAGAYNPAFFSTYQQTQHAQPGQQYWPQQQHGGYGHGQSQ